MPQEIIRTIVKSGDQPVSSTTITSDTKLLLAVSPNEIWKFRFFVAFNIAGATSGIKFALAGPSAPTTVRYHVTIYDANGVFVTTCLAAFGTEVVAAILAAGDYHAEIEGSVENGANSGNLVMQFAQNVTDGSNPVTVRKCSTLEYLAGVFT